MKLHQLEALVAIADCGGIRAAARRLDISQAAVTKAMRELEVEQQLPLLVRQANGVVFTDYGKTLLTHARLVVSQMTRAQVELAQMRGHAEGKLTIGVTPWIALTLLPEAVRQFREKMPAIRLEIFEGLMAVTLPGLRNGEIDFAIGPMFSWMSTQEFECEYLMSFEAAVTARRGHPKAQCTSLHELLEEDWVINFAPAARDSFMHNLFWQHNAYIDEARIVRAQSLLLILQLTCHSDMLGYCPLPLIASEPFRSVVQPLKLVEKFEVFRLGIICRRNTARSAAAQCFIDCLLSVLRRRSRSSKTEDTYLFDNLTLLI